jgi:hypothetical protein
MDGNLIEKTLKRLKVESIDETLLDELQTKVCSFILILIK